MNKLQAVLLGMTITVVLPLSVVEAQKYDRNNSDYTYADVVEVEPVLRYVRVEVPRKECWDEEVYYEDRKRKNNRRHARRGSAGATIAGGLIGGVIGRQFGGGDGRDAMTVVGTLVGSALANDRHRRNRDYREDYDSDSDDYYGDDSDSDERRYRTETVERCDVRREVREEERIDGYRVTYVYDGREYTTRTERDPGDKIRVRVSVSPAEY